MTRGPNFVLPPDVVASLCRVRDAESQTNKWEPWCLWLDTIEYAQKLPAPLETIAQLFEGEADENDQTCRRPTVSELLQEIVPKLNDKATHSSIIIGGEGEPLLRLSALMTLVRSVKERSAAASVRVTTNGLAAESTAQQLADCGVDSLSVALMTHDPDLYDVLMEPVLNESDASNARARAHHRVCSFIQASIKAGLKVEATAVDQPKVDKAKTEALASSLGITERVRWRSYFA
jgi:TatD family-associated radical SAM protein